jgi:hypothetical protein
MCVRTRKSDVQGYQRGVHFYKRRLLFYLRIVHGGGNDIIGDIHNSQSA